MRYHIYLQNNDEDIMLLLQKRKLAELTRTVVRAEINGENPSIPLPKIPATMKQPRSVQLRLDDEEDSDVIEWLANIKQGYMSTVIKLLIRHAMEKPDIRLFVNDSEVEITARKSNSVYAKDSGNTEKPKPSKEDPKILEPEKQNNKNNDLFDLI